MIKLKKINFMKGLEKKVIKRMKIKFKK